MIIFKALAFYFWMSLEIVNINNPKKSWLLKLIPTNIKDKPELKLRSFKPPRLGR